MKLYVGNLAFATSSQDLQELFAAAGTVESASIVEDRDTGRSRGIWFVEMATKEEGEAAISQFNGKELSGRSLKVNEAKLVSLAQVAAVVVVVLVVVVVAEATAVAVVAATAADSVEDIASPGGKHLMFD
jgi:RNA recognition motif-containing protein